MRSREQELMGDAAPRIGHGEIRSVRAEVFRGYQGRRRARYARDMTGILQVSTATETKQTAVSLVNEAVRQRFAASAQIKGPVTSAFWHYGEFGTGEEWEAVLLTTEDRYPDLEAFLLANHPWKNPQLTAVVVERASAGFVEWARQAVSASSAP